MNFKKYCRAHSIFLCIVVCLCSLFGKYIHYLHIFIIKWEKRTIRKNEPKGKRKERYQENEQKWRMKMRGKWAKKDKDIWKKIGQ